MGWLNWNDDPRDDENEAEIRGILVISFVVAVCFVVLMLNVTI